MTAKYLFALACVYAAQAHGQIVAAESAYADIARQLAGPAMPVLAILKNPATDPHEFEPGAATARAVAGARVVIENGIGYDPWMDRLLAASHAPGQARIVVASLLNKQPGNNPHLWYDPAAMPALTRTLFSVLATNALTAERPGLAERCMQTLASLAALQTRIDALRVKFAGTEVAATEPVFGPMIAALGLSDRHARFEVSVMNGTEPRAGDVASIEDDLRAHRIRALITNAQATDPQAARLAALARAENIPLVAVTETLPPGKTYQQWIGDELLAMDTALSPSASSPPASPTQ